MNHTHKNGRSGIEGSLPRPCEFGFIPTRAPSSESSPLPKPAELVVTNERDLPECSDPCCRIPAEWILPEAPDAVLKRDPMHFCAAHMASHMAFLRDTKGFWAQDQAQHRALPAKPLYRELVSNRHAQQVLDTVDEFLRSGMEPFEALSATRNLLNRLRDPRELLR